MNCRFARVRGVVLLSVLCLAWAVALASDATPWLRGGYGWRWPYEPVLDLRRIVPLLMAVVLYVPVALWLRQRHTISLLMWAVAGGIGLTLAAVHVRSQVLHWLFTITVAGLPSGWHMAAARITDLAGTLREWPRFMAASGAFSSHMTTSPPGMVLLYHVAGRLLAGFPALADALGGSLRLMQCQNMALMAQSNAQLASAWLGMLMPAWASLTVLPLYSLGRRVFGPAAARWSAVWWPLVPSLLMFAPLPNTFYSLPSLGVILLLTEGLRRDRRSLVFLAGLLMSALTFMVFTFTPLLLLAGFFTLAVFWSKRSAAHLPWHWPLQIGLWFAAGLSSCWLAFYATTGAQVWEIWRAALVTHFALGRPYWPWLVLNINDFFMFTGWPLALLALIAVGRTAGRILSGRHLSEGDLMTAAATLAFVTLDISGTLRGETGRLLLFISPWLLLAAATVAEQERVMGAVLTVVQAILLVVMVVCLHVLASELPTSPPVVPYSAPPEAGAQVLPSGTVFGDAARLRAFSGRIETRRDAEGHEQAVLVVWLDWQPLRPMSSTYYLSFLPVAPDGEVAPKAALFQPFANQYPTTCWKPCDGELRDRYEIPLFKEQPGDWWVSFSLYDARALRGLDVVAPDGSRDVQVGLGPFR